MQGNESSDLNWTYFNTICHLSPLSLFFFMFYYGHFETQKLRAVLYYLHPNPFPTSQFCTDLFWRKSQSYLVNLLNVKSILQRWPICLSVYVCICLFIYAMLHGLWKPSSLTRGGTQALSSESAESSTLDCHRTQPELNLCV